MPNSPDCTEIRQPEHATRRLATHLTSGLGPRWMPCRIVAYENECWANVSIGDEMDTKHSPCSYRVLTSSLVSLDRHDADALIGHVHSEAKCDADTCTPTQSQPMHITRMLMPNFDNDDDEEETPPTTTAHDKADLQQTPTTPTARDEADLSGAGGEGSNSITITSDSCRSRLSRNPSGTMTNTA